MTFQELQDLCSYWLDDLQFGYFTPTQVQLFLNNAQFEVQKQLIQAGENFYTKCVSTTTIMNESCIALPSDFLKLNHIEIITSGTFPNECKQPMEHVTEREADAFNYSPSTPATFFLRKNCLILRPMPDQAYPLKMTYSYRVTPMTLPTEVPDVPQQYHEYIAVLATLDGFLKDQRDPGPFIDKRNFYVDMMKKDAEDRLRDSPRHVVISYNDDYGMLF